MKDTRNYPPLFTTRNKEDLHVILFGYPVIKQVIADYSDGYFYFGLDYPPKGCNNKHQINTSLGNDIIIQQIVK